MAKAADLKARKRENQRQYRLRTPDKPLSAEQKAAKLERQRLARAAKTPTQREAARLKRARQRSIDRDKITAYQRDWIRKKFGHEERPGLGAYQPTAQLRTNAIYAAARAAVVRVPADVRDDIVSMICLAVLEGEITLADVPKMTLEFTRRHYREFNPNRTISLDDVPPGCDFGSLHAYLAAQDAVTPWN